MLSRTMRRLADTLEHIEPDFANTVNVAPTIGFEKEMTIDLGKRTAESDVAQPRQHRR